MFSFAFVLKFTNQPGADVEIYVMTTVFHFVARQFAVV